MAETAKYPVHARACALFSGLVGMVVVSGICAEPTGYVSTEYGNVVQARSGCVHTPRWSKDLATEECDPSLVAKKEVAVAAVAPAPRAIERSISLKSDALFGFDDATLTEAGGRHLDEIVNEAGRQLQDQYIRITGYTDRIGPDSYNLTLSQRRAEAVKAYLVSKGVPQASISVDGRGSADPVVGCEGERGAALIECLAPNRRTEVNFSAVEIVEELPQQ